MWAELRKHRLRAMIVALVLFPLNSLSQQREAVVVIRMTDALKFVPDQVTIRVGQTVKWINEADEGGAPHTVTTDPEKVADPKHVSIPEGAKPFDSGSINPGKSYMHTFKVPGVYKYACAPHEGMMRGEITVEP
ncbi:MAG TPA: plastocyanin/azurin family copper-binding protein [Candidatus Acidoferrales bacterium]|nr:plastocyanin/azurin family copper-binding protein [Candidatus Acidoferrales bacterium]